jgi:spore maturation protein CgeB
MKFTIFGLTVSSSWGNGHATLWRGLIRALTSMGHEVVFFERDVPYYAETRDLNYMGERAQLVLYSDWPSILSCAIEHVARADVAIVTSYCPDGIAASNLILSKGSSLRIFYDLDTPVTLAQLQSGASIDYLPPEGLGEFDLVLSYTGGEALQALQDRLDARRVAPLYGHVDPEQHHPAPGVEAFKADLSYLGTFAADRQTALEKLFVEPARLCPHMRFVLAGSGYRQDFPWTENIFFVKHLPPSDHPSFFCSSRLTLNVTRGDMAIMGYCPSGRLFEAAACGVPVLSDWWEGLDCFFEPRSEILVARSSGDAIDALSLDRGELEKIARAAQARVLEEHTSVRRAQQLIDLLHGINDQCSVPAVKQSPHNQRSGSLLCGE